MSVRVRLSILVGLLVLGLWLVRTDSPRSASEARQAVREQPRTEVRRSPTPMQPARVEPITPASVVPGWTANGGPSSAEDRFLDAPQANTAPARPAERPPEPPRASVDAVPNVTDDPRDFELPTR